MYIKTEILFLNKESKQLARFYVYCTLQLLFACPGTGKMYPSNQYGLKNCGVQV
jgi:hypothetical protein